MAKEKQKHVRVSSIGGQALLEGVMMRGSSAMALAVRDPQGEIQLESYRLKGRRWYNKAPLIRGVVSFLQSLVTGMRMLMRSASVSADEDEQIGKGGMAFSVILGIVLAVGIFIVLPEMLSDLLKRFALKGIRDEALQILIISLAAGILRILIFILYLALVSRMKDIRRTFMYHGAEHRTINCYEKGLPLTVENVQSCSTRHKRCGTTFLFLVMIVSILIFALTNYIILLAGGGTMNMVYKTLIKLGLLPIVAGLSFEVLKLFAFLPENWFTRLLTAPGLALQRLTTFPPEDEMVEVALLSFNTVMAMQEDPYMEPVHFFEYQYSDVLAKIRLRLQAVQAEEAEAYWILSHVTGIKRGQLSQIKIIDDTQYKQITDILRRRESGEPLDYILGYTYFYGRKVFVNADVLIPRMETELMCELALKEIGDKKCKVLDLCTGSGCIALTIVSESNAVVTAADISENALAVAARNLEGKPCEIVLSDLFSNIRTKYDMILCNPPYIRSGDLSGLQPEVQAQPKLALDGGVDGLYYYREIIKTMPDYLNSGSMVIFEIAHDQAEDVKVLLRENFDAIKVIKDLCGSNRFVRARFIT